jgi:5,10-methylenetetrahydromethanopterin reductase
MIPEDRRHQAIQDGQLVALNDVDRGVVTGELLTRLRLAADAEGHRARLDEYVQAGITEAVYQPAGPDIPRELEAFATMARSAPGVRLKG